MDSKRLAQYPERVRQVKRLRKQVTGLTRAIRRRDASLEQVRCLVRVRWLTAPSERGVLLDRLRLAGIALGSFVTGAFLSSLV